MKVAIRTDASEQIGTGHVMRCLTLAEKLRGHGCQLQFICRDHPGHMSDMITRHGFKVSMLPEPEQPFQADPYKEDYALWLGVTQEEDAKQTIEVLGTDYPDWLIVDHYGLDVQSEKTLRPYVENIMVIDDLANRKHDCDLLLDQNFSLEPEKRYSDLVPEYCRQLLGPRYALLRPEYAESRKTMNPRTGKIKRVLLFLGGSDGANITGMALDALSVPELAHLEVDVVVGANNPNKDVITKQVDNRPYTYMYNSRPHLADLMARADLAIGGGGVTTWERMCLGLPSIIICIAENQRPACQALSQTGLAHYLGFWTDISKADLTEKVNELLESEELLRFQALACQTMVDGLGAKRVAEVLYPSSKSELYLRPAQRDDVFIYFDWVNDPVVRQNAFNSEPVSLNTHMEWFENKLADPDTYMFVLQARDLPVGQVRFELQGNEAIIDYSLDQLVRGRGWGSELVRLGANMLNNIQPTFIKCQVKEDNQTSSAIFMRLGFEESSVQGGGRHFSIALLSDSGSWLNNYLPILVQYWLLQGHRILWTHNREELQPADFCFYLSCGQIVPARILNKFKHNLVVHESDLPQGKGWSPLTWQILEGNNRVPVTLIEAGENVDSGVIYAQELIDFQGDELVEELRSEQAKATIRLCKKFVLEYPGILDSAQEQTGEESFYPKRRPEDSRLDVDKSIREQFNLLRVVDNEKYPAFFDLHDQRYVLKVEKKTN